MRTLAQAVLVAAAAFAAAKAAAQQDPVFRVGLDIVNLTLSVRDAKGRLVSDLGADDFEVYEDGRRQTLQLFARAAAPPPGARRVPAREDESLALDLGMLMDTSQSMAKQMAFSQEAVARFLEAVPRARDLLTIFFDQDIRLSRYDSEHQQGLLQRIFESKASGNTALYDAITVYLSRVADAEGRKVLVVFTDGDDTTSAIRPAELIGLVRGSSVTIFPIAFLSDLPPGSPEAVRARSFLFSLAELSGGQIFMPTSPKDLPGIYERILEELRAQYVVGYTSDNPKQDAKYRKLRVEVKRPGLKVRHRPGYTAPGSAG